LNDITNIGTWLRIIKYNNRDNHYVAYKMEHLITNLTMPELNLTCLREREEHLCEREEQSTIDTTTCCLTHPSSWLKHLGPYLYFGN
jgi:hypothetical protein